MHRVRVSPTVDVSGRVRTAPGAARTEANDTQMLGGKLSVALALAIAPAPRKRRAIWDAATPTTTMANALATVLR